MPSTFIGYRRDDAAGYAGRLHEALERRLGRDAIFRDVDTLEPGQDFVDAIGQRLGDCKVFLALIGREWLDARDRSGQRRLDQSNDYVRLEIAAALARPDVRMIPVLIEGADIPPPEALPEDIRSLARKQAVSIRDEAWDQDVDRLASVIAKLTGNPSEAVTKSAVSSAPVKASRLRGLALAAVGLIVAAVAVSILARFAREGPAGPADPADPADNDAIVTGVATTVSEPAASPVRPAVAGSLPAYGVAVPRIAEVVHASLIYSLLSAAVTPTANDTNELTLRFRFTNQGRYDANAWDATFRLAADGQTLAPTGGLNEIVHALSSMEGIVVFTVPAMSRRVVVRVVDGNRVGELPLDLSPTASSVDEKTTAAGDSSSLAIVLPIVREPRVLMRGEDLVATVVRASSRRFANAVRLNFEVRLAAQGRYAVHSGAATLRLAVGDNVLAPLEAPNIVVEPVSDIVTEFEFEVPPSTTRVVLKGSALNAAGEMPIDVPK
jgi:TIR domain-containing protein